MSIRPVRRWGRAIQKGLNVKGRDHGATHSVARLPAMRALRKCCAPAVIDFRPMLYMVIEHYKARDPVPVYRRFAQLGRLAPPGLTYVASWVEASLSRCYQVMETDDPVLLEQWMAAWSDIVEFDIIPVITSAEAAARMGYPPAR